MLWATEALPLYVTSLCIPMLVVSLRVLVDNTVTPPARLAPQQAAPAIFHSMFSQVGPRVDRCQGTSGFGIWANFWPDMG
jgi:hypothetical protein